MKHEIDACVNKTKSGRQVEGYVEAFCHRATYRYWGFPPRIRLTPDNLRSLEYQAEQRIRESIAEEFSSGELCGIINDNEIRGWWEIDKT